MQNQQHIRCAKGNRDRPASDARYRCVCSSWQLSGGSSHWLWWQRENLPSMKKRSNRAFSLVEVTLALGIAAFCLIAVFGLMPVGVQINRNATSQTAATNIIGAIIADLRA